MIVVSGDNLSPDGDQTVSSQDGIVWTNREDNVTDPMYGVACNGTDEWFVGGGTGSGFFTSSSNGTSWAAGFAGSLYFRSARWDGTRFICAAETGNAGYCVDPINATAWTFVDTLLATCEDVEVGSGLHMAGGSNGEVSTSPDLTTWTVRDVSALGATSFGSNTVNGVAYSPSLDRWVIVGPSGKLATSDDDGVSWTDRTSAFGTTGILRVRWLGGQFVAVGFSGKISTSSDGITWTARTSTHGTDAIRDIAYDSDLGLYIAVGANRRISTSPDAIAWTERYSNVGDGTFYGVAASPVPPPPIMTYADTIDAVDTISTTVNADATPVTAATLHLVPTAPSGTATTSVTAATLHLVPTTETISWVGPRLVDSVAASVTITPFWSVFFADAADASTTLSSLLSVALAESVAALDTTIQPATLSLVFSDTARLSEALRTARVLALSESVDASAALLVTLSAALADAIQLSSPISSRLDAVALAVQGLAAADLTGYYFGGTFADSIDASDPLSSLLTAIEKLTDALDGADSAEATGSVVFLAADSAAAAAGATSVATLINTLIDNLQAVLTFTLDGERYTGWVLNAETAAASRYTAFDYNSLGHFNGKTYAANASGIYALTGADDAGSAIAAKAATGLTDFGSDRMVRLTEAALGYTSDGELVLKLSATRSGNVRERWFRLAPRTANAPRSAVVDFARGIDSRYWKFELENKDGADFTLDVIHLYPLILSRRS